LTVPIEEISVLREEVRAVGEKTAREPFCMRTVDVGIGRVYREGAELTNGSSASNLNSTETHKRH